MEHASRNCFQEYFFEDANEAVCDVVGNEFQKNRLIELVDQLDRYCKTHSDHPHLLAALGMDFEVKLVMERISNLVDVMEKFFEGALLENTGVPHDLLFRQENLGYIDSLVALRSSIDLAKQHIAGHLFEDQVEFLGRISLLVESTFEKEFDGNRDLYAKNRSLLIALLVFCVRSDGDDFYRNVTFFNDQFVSNLKIFSAYFSELQAKTIFDVFFRGSDFKENPLGTYQCSPSFKKQIEFIGQVIDRLIMSAQDLCDQFKEDADRWHYVGEKLLYAGAGSFDREAADLW